MTVRSILFFTTLAVLWFFNIHSLPLIKPDEGRYAEISREMNATHDYITPRVNGIKYFEKPPLQYWGSALIFKAFGESDGTARLYVALLGFFCLLSVFFFVRRYYSSEDTAQVATAFLAGSVLFCAQGRVNNLDMGLTFFMTLTGLSLAVLMQKKLSQRDYFHANIIFWLSLALGFLSKGLVAIVLPGLVGVLFMFLTWDFSVFRRVYWLRGTLLFLFVALPWVILCSQKNPEFFQFFFVHEHFERFLTKVHQREGPVWYFIPLFAIGFFPWNLLLFRYRKFSPLSLFFLVWSLAIFVFFSVSSSKLPAYILPIWPPLAILAAENVFFYAKKWDRKLIGTSLLLLGAILLVGSFFTTEWISSSVSLEMLKGTQIYLQGAGGVLLTAALIVLFINFSWKKQILLCGLCSLLSYQMIYLGYGQFSPSMSSAVTAKAVQSYSKNKDFPIYMVQYYEHELPFYLQRLVTLVDYRGELDFGINQEDVGRYISMNQFLEAWQKDHEAIAILPLDLLPLLNDLKHKLIYQDLRRCIIGKETFK